MKALIIGLIILIVIGIYLYTTSSKNKAISAPIKENFETLSTIVIPGGIYDMTVNYVSTTSNVYGTGPFAIIGSSGSDLYNAAQFRGIPNSTSSTKKTIRIQIIQPQPKAYFGGVSNAGVTTTTLIQTGNIKGFIFLHAGQTYTITVTGNADNTKTNLWGTGPFMDTSNIGKAATYAGLLKVGETGPVTISYIPRQTSYAGGSNTVYDLNGTAFTVISTANTAPKAPTIAFNFILPPTTTLATTTTTTLATTTTTTTLPTTTQPFLNSPQFTYDTLIYRYNNTNTSGGLDLTTYENDEQIIYTYLQGMGHVNINRVSGNILDQKYVSYDPIFQRYNILYSPENKIITNSMIRGIIYYTNSAFSFWIKPNNINQICPIMGRNRDINIYQDGTSLVIVLYGIKTYAATETTAAYSEYFSFPERWNNIFELNKWSHIIIGWNGTTLTVYKNGIAMPKTLNAIYDTSLLMGYFFSMATSSLNIGGNELDGKFLYNDTAYTSLSNYKPYFSGNIMEIKEFDNTTLNNAIATQIYKLPVPITYPTNIYVVDPATTYAGFSINISSKITTTLPTTTTTLPTTTTTTLPTTTTTTTLPTTTTTTTTLPTTTTTTTTLPTTTTTTTTTLPTTTTTTLPTTTTEPTTTTTTTLPTTTTTTTLPTTTTTTTLPTTTTTTTLPTTTEPTTTTTTTLPTTTTTTTLPTTTEPTTTTTLPTTTEYLTSSPSTSLYTTSTSLPETVFTSTTGYTTYPTYTSLPETGFTSTTGYTTYPTYTSLPETGFTSTTGYTTYPTYTSLPETGFTSTTGYTTYPTYTSLPETGFTSTTGYTTYPTYTSLPETGFTSTTMYDTYTTLPETGFTSTTMYDTYTTLPETGFTSTTGYTTYPTYTTSTTLPTTSTTLPTTSTTLPTTSTTLPTTSTTLPTTSTTLPTTSTTLPTTSTTLPTTSTTLPTTSMPVPVSSVPFITESIIPDSGYGNEQYIPTITYYSSLTPNPTSYIPPSSYSDGTSSSIIDVLALS